MNPNPPPEPVAHETVSVWGSAWFGLLNIPARIRVNPDELVLGASILGEFRFTPDQVIAVRQGFGPSVRIDHIRPDVPQSISFWPALFGPATAERVAEAGFVPTAKPSDAPVLEPVFHRHFVALLVFAQLAFGVAVAWRSQWEAPTIDPLAVAWVGSALLIALLIRFQGPVRRFAVNSEIGFGRVRPFLNLSTAILILLSFEILAMGLGW